MTRTHNLKNLAAIGSIFAAFTLAASPAQANPFEKLSRLVAKIERQVSDVEQRTNEIESTANAAQRIVRKMGIAPAQNGNPGTEADQAPYQEPYTGQTMQPNGEYAEPDYNKEPASQAYVQNAPDPDMRDMQSDPDAETAMQPETASTSTNRNSQ